MKPKSYVSNPFRLETVTEDEHVYYFAYGSNMSRRQMRQRCPKAKYQGVALLRDWKLRERQFADVEKHRDHVVHGTAWKVTKDCERKLDLYEGVRGGLYRRVWDWITLANGARVYALIYTETKETKRDREGVPFSLSYAALCTEAAIECKLPVHRLYKQRIKAYAESMGESVDIRREALNW